MDVYLYLFVQVKKMLSETLQSQHSLQENCLQRLNVGFGQKKSEQIRNSGICTKRQKKHRVTSDVQSLHITPLVKATLMLLLFIYCCILSLTLQ